MERTRLVPLSRGVHGRPPYRHESPKVQYVPEEVLDDLGNIRTPQQLPSDVRSARLSGAPRQVLDLRGAEPEHQLVVLGDSISQGFRSFAIGDTSWAWPSIVARGVGLAGFRRPQYDTPARCPGLPLDVESALRDVLGPPRSGRFDMRALFAWRDLMDDVEDSWERGAGAEQVMSSLVDSDALPNHNLSFYGADLRDCLSLSKQELTSRLGAAPNLRDNVFRQIPAASAARSAAVALSGGKMESSMIDHAEQLARNGGIGTLVVALGANNVLGSVLSLRLDWSSDDSYQDLTGKESSTIWQPHHFRAEYDELAARVASCSAQRVVLVTVPHVTIAPSLKGHGSRSGASRYFDYYTHPWVRDSEFNPRKDRYLTRDQVRVVDQTISLYNAHIVRTAKEYGWHVFDLAALLDRLAYRRYIQNPGAQPNWWTPYELPREYMALDVPPDSRFLAASDGVRTAGGLFSLDGTHPSICASAVIAHEVLLLMQQSGATVVEERPDFAAAVQADRSLLCPPPRIDLALEFARGASRLSSVWHRFRSLLHV